MRVGQGVGVSRGVAVGRGVRVGHGVAVGRGVGVSRGGRVGQGVAVASGVRVGHGVALANGVRVGLLSDAACTTSTRGRPAVGWSTNVPKSCIATSATPATPRPAPNQLKCSIVILRSAS